MQPAFLEKPTAILGEQQLFTDLAECRSYGYDNSTLQGQPLAVALPDSHDQVAAIVGARYAHQVHVLARGQGTGTTGATVPLDDRSLIVSLQRMNRILELDRNNRLMVVEPGVTNQAVQAATRQLFLRQMGKLIHRSRAVGPVGTGRQRRSQPAPRSTVSRTAITGSVA